MDFGIARLCQSQAAPSGGVIGTAYYMAPEQLRVKRGVDHRVDQFSLGVVLYEMLTGELARSGPCASQYPQRYTQKPLPGGNESSCCEPSSPSRKHVGHSPVAWQSQVFRSRSKPCRIVRGRRRFGFDIWNEPFDAARPSRRGPQCRSRDRCDRTYSGNVYRPSLSDLASPIVLPPSSDGNPKAKVSPSASGERYVGRR